MLTLALLAATLPTIPAAPPPVPLPAPGRTRGDASPDQQHYAACAALAGSDPAAALRDASAWRLQGGQIPARQCEGLAYVAQQRFEAAQAAFAAGAHEAETRGDGRSAILWVQAGNAALARSDPGAARTAFDAAIARGVLTGFELGEAYLDRARARYALHDLAGARVDLDAALKLVPADPLAWLLSATLARQTGDLVRARSDIAAATQRSPDDAQVMLEAGNIAVVSGDDAGARLAWTSAAKASASPASAAAADALKRLDAAPSR